MTITTAAVRARRERERDERRETEARNRQQPLGDARKRNGGSACHSGA
jgi:hypothetical protein